jgi:hypothetical protein
MLHGKTISRWKLKAALSALLLILFISMRADVNVISKRAVLKSHILGYYPEQLTNPQKKNRRSMSQFGYNLYLFRLPLYPIYQFINPKDFGVQSYSKPWRKEHNGVLYTCRGGFIDFSHLRAAADWTVFLTFKILTEAGDFDLPSESGSLSLHFKNLDELSTEDIGTMAQKIAFERLVWHEAASWYYHLPNHRTEQQSAFTPEDPYSNLLGTLIGKNIALRILRDFESLSYSEIATEEIAKVVASLHPLNTIEGSKKAYDIVDRYKQLKLPEDQRNEDVWYDSQIIFMDPRYVFKRDMTIGPKKEPWLVPHQEQLGCSANIKPSVLSVPQKTQTGVSLYDYYEFTIQPDSSLFINKRTKQEWHKPFGTFSTKDFNRIISQVGNEMEKELLPGFDKRDNKNPVASYKKVRKVIGRY